MHDDTLPDVPPDDDSLSAALDVYHYRASKGEIVRDGIVYDADTDWFTRTALLAQVRELHEHLRIVIAERDDAVTTMDVVIGVQADTRAVCEKAFAECDRLMHERDRLEGQVETLRNEIQTMRDVAHTIKERPVASALLLLAANLLPLKGNTDNE